MCRSGPVLRWSLFRADVDSTWEPVSHLPQEDISSSQCLPYHGAQLIRPLATDCLQAKHFTDHETLHEWRTQLASGDFLDEEQVTDLETRIKVHIAREQESHDEYDSNVGEPSKKRQKLVGQMRSA